MAQRHPRSRELLERDDQLDAVGDALADLTGARDHPRGGVLAFAGPAGLGKTTLLSEVRDRAAARGCTVLSARGSEQEQQVAFHVARQLLQPKLASIGDAEIRATLGSWYGIVGPALGLCTAEGPAPDPQGLRDGLDWVLTHLAVQHAPVVLVLDDAHWADMQSLTWLSAFAPRADELALLIVVAYRPDELPAGAEAFRGMSGRAGHRPIDLEPLTAAAVTTLVRDEVADHADEAFCRECWEVTSGNPFEAVELTAKLRARGVSPDETSTHLVAGLAAGVKGPGLITRLERLGTSTVRLAWAAAVLGTEIKLPLAATLAALGKEQAADCAERLRDARVLTGGETLEFVHPVIATSIYQSIPQAFRVGLHGAAAAAVIDAGQGPVAAARHLLESQPEGDPRVVGQLRSAAAETMRAGAPEAARDMLLRALREPPQDDERAAVLYELGCASQLLEPSATINHLRAALEEPIDDPALRDGILFRLSQSLAHSDRMTEAAELVGKAAREAKNHRSKLRMQAEQFMWDAFRADEPDSPSRSRRLARFADVLPGRDRTERYIIALRAWDATLRGEPTTTVLHHAGRALEAGLPWADENHGFEVPALAAMTYMYADQPDRAEEYFATGIADFERLGWRGAHLSFGLVLLGYIRYRRGRLAEAEELTRDGLRLAERVGRGTPVQWYSVAVLIEILLARGRVDEATALAADYSFQEPFPATVTFPDAQAVHGELLLARGMYKEAAAELASVGRRLDPRGMRNPAWCPWQLHLALAESHDAPDRAERTALDVVARAKKFGAHSTIGHSLRVAAQVVGGERGLELFAEAVAELEDSPSAYELACALVMHGAALRRSGALAEAVDRLHPGLEGALRCGAEGLAETARRELALIAPLRPAGVPGARYRRTGGTTGKAGGDRPPEA